ncbi:MAG: SGNH/GDSL hydrolase family protein [Chitinophagaceae bacterium]|nr:SGNH/GDSL hydrolase family protein [Chitinophagaceae bacterium]
MKGANRNNKTYTYLAIGDSYTIGEQVNSRDNFPNQAVSLLKQKDIDMAGPVIIARTGWTTDELAEAIANAKLHPPYDFVTLLIGVNNQYRGRPVNDYITEFESLLKQAIRFAGNDTGHVIVLSIPDWGVTPFAEGRDRQQIAAEVDAYNAANKQVADVYKVHYIDITPGTRQAAKDTLLLTTDGLHPSGKEYRRWAEQVAAIIEKKTSF